MLPFPWLVPSTPVLSPHMGEATDAESPGICSTPSQGLFPCRSCLSSTEQPSRIRLAVASGYSPAKEYTGRIEIGFIRTSLLIRRIFRLYVSIKILQQKMQKLSLWRPPHLHGLQCFLELITYYNEDPPGFHGALYSSTFLFSLFPYFSWRYICITFSVIT